VRVGNDLEPAACALCPVIVGLTGRLRESGATVASMTGSGSAVFGIFRDTTALDRAYDAVVALGFTASRCVPVGRTEYRRHLGLP